MNPWWLALIIIGSAGCGALAALFYIAITWGRDWP